MGIVEGFSSYHAPLAPPYFLDGDSGQNDAPFERLFFTVRTRGYATWEKTELEGAYRASDQPWTIS